MDLLALAPRAPHASTTATVAARPADPAVQLADRLLDAHGVRAQSGMLCRENLATYLFHAVGREEVSELLRSPEPITLDMIRTHTQKMAAHRWIVKIERDLKAPYQDHEVFERLEQLDSSFRDEVIRLQSASHGAKYRIMINGSLCKGRMGRNSDIDGQVETDDPTFRNQLLGQFRSQTHDNVSFYPLSAGAEGKVEERLSGPVLDLGDGSKLLGDRHYLTHYYIDVMRGKGYKIVTGADGKPQVIDYTPPAERRREAHLVVEKFFERTRTDIQGNENWRRFKKASFTVAGALLSVPVAGAAVRWALEKLVPSTNQPGQQSA